MDDASWLDEAWREFGEAERAGAASNPRIIAMYRDAGHPDVKNDEVAWCAAFVGAILERAGLRSSRSLLARSYLAWGDALPKPRIGAIAVLSRGSDPSQGHVGFWLAERDDWVLVLGGNQGNAVSVARYPKSRLLAVRWPAALQTAQQSSARSGSDTFEKALAHVLEMEGGFTDDANDPGGPTNRGITLAVFAAWNRVKLSDANRAALIRDLKQIDTATVREIYRKRYWDTAHCAELHPALGFMHFDAAVNHGFGTAIRCLQEAVGVDVDGEFGPETRAAVARAPLSTILENYASIRRRRYRALPHFWRFGRGWLRRVETTLERARILAAETVPQSPLQTEGDTDMTAIQSNQKWWGHSVTIWGTIVTILSTVVPALAPVTGIDVSGDLVQNAGEQVVDTVQTVGTLIGTLMTIYGRLRATKPIALGLFKMR